jgi:alpha-aminoadipic semialdehyde synthase
VGILRETKTGEKRCPLAPHDVRWLVEHGVKVMAESSPQRIFTDDELASAGASVVSRADGADLLLGIKEPRIDDLIPGKIYAVFSHTIKGQSHNMLLLSAILDRKITLLDYECIVDRHGGRLVYFGRFAGICGMVNGLHYLGAKLQARGYPTVLTGIRPAHTYNSIAQARTDVETLCETIERVGLPEPMVPFIVGITGHGHVSQGAQEVLDWLNPIEIHPRDIAAFVRHEKTMTHRIFKIVLLREEKLRARDGKGFYFEEYIEDPDRFESNLDIYLPYLTMLVHTSYWDERYPRLVTRAMLRDLIDSTRRLRLQFIADLSCDLKGSIEITERVATIDRPTFTYDPRADLFVDGHEADGITILAIDNLPAELPHESSVGFSGQIRNYVYQLATHGLAEGDEWFALPAELRGALITHRGRLTSRFAHLERYLGTISLATADPS